ncbi:MAG: hypothetical protein ACD_73C00139G0001 [uncultured bacterium]|nr:MAG: hypothetical protein ACD_73C00139G0001 [uncultured bacterium]
MPITPTRTKPTPIAVQQAPQAPTFEEDADANIGFPTIDFDPKPSDYLEMIYGGKRYQSTFIYHSPKPAINPFKMLASRLSVNLGMILHDQVYTIWSAYEQALVLPQAHREDANVKRLTVLGDLFFLFRKSFSDEPIGWWPKLKLRLEVWQQERSYRKFLTSDEGVDRAKRFIRYGDLDAIMGKDVSVAEKMAALMRIPVLISKMTNDQSWQPIKKQVFAERLIERVVLLRNLSLACQALIEKSDSELSKAFQAELLKTVESLQALKANNIDFLLQGSEFLFDGTDYGTDVMEAFEETLDGRDLTVYEAFLARFKIHEGDVARVKQQQEDFSKKISALKPLSELEQELRAYKQGLTLQEEAVSSYEWSQEAQNKYKSILKGNEKRVDQFLSQLPEMVPLIEKLQQMTFLQVNAGEHTFAVIRDYIKEVQDKMEEMSYSMNLWTSTMNRIVVLSNGVKASLPKLKEYLAQIEQFKAKLNQEGAYVKHHVEKGEAYQMLAALAKNNQSLLARHELLMSGELDLPLTDIEALFSELAEKTHKPYLEESIKTPLGITVHHLDHYQKEYAAHKDKIDDLVASVPIFLKELDGLSQTFTTILRREKTVREHPIPAPLPEAINKDDISSKIGAHRQRLTNLNHFQFDGTKLGGVSKSLTAEIGAIKTDIEALRVKFEPYFELAAVMKAYETTTFYQGKLGYFTPVEVITHEQRLFVIAVKAGRYALLEWSKNELKTLMGYKSDVISKALFIPSKIPIIIVGGHFFMLPPNGKVKNIEGAEGLRFSHKWFQSGDYIVYNDNRGVYLITPQGRLTFLAKDDIKQYNIYSNGPFFYAQVSEIVIAVIDAFRKSFYGTVLKTKSGALVYNKYNNTLDVIEGDKLLRTVPFFGNELIVQGDHLSYIREGTQLREPLQSFLKTTVTTLLAGITYFMGFIGDKQEAHATEPAISALPGTTLILPASNANDINLTEEDLKDFEEVSITAGFKQDVDGSPILAYAIMPFNAATGFATSGGVFAAIK